MRVLIDSPPDRRSHQGPPSCASIAAPDLGSPPFVVAYRLRFALDHAATIRLHISADERYDLFLDGTRIGRGNEYGDPQHWFFDTYDLQLQPGPHVLVARVWSFGALAPLGQMSIAHGLWCAPDDPAWLPVFGTGVAAWDAKRLDGYTFAAVAQIDAYFAIGPLETIDGSRYAWGFARGAGDGWKPIGHNVHTDHQRYLTPALLPPMLEEPITIGVARAVTEAPADDWTAAVFESGTSADALRVWTALFQSGSPVTIPAFTSRRVIIDLDTYVCAYPSLLVLGGRGGRITLRWAESLFDEPQAKTKGDRSAIDGKYFVGIGDTFLPDGGADRCFEPLWWRAGRYLELVVQTAAEPLTIARLTLRETHYPLAIEATFQSDDERLNRLVPLMTRSLLMCAHETYVDCPYYEQLMYVGDTRLEVLATYLLSRDDRLPRKAIQLFDRSRQQLGLTFSRYPSHDPQTIPPFSLWWVAMVYDYALWRDDRRFVQALMPGVRAVMKYFHSRLNADGLVEAPEGWNFVDWVPEWSSGVPPAGAQGVSGVINWHYALTLTFVERLERWLGETDRASQARQLAQDLGQRLIAHFWDDERTLLADDLERRCFSEHTQSLALLSELLPPSIRQHVGAGLLHDPALARTTIYFSHYLFEAYRLLGRTDRLLERLGLWFELESLGLKTTFEMPEPSRSDCHGWGAHPLYHYGASLLGIRPASFGFATVAIRPQPGPLKYLRGSVAHPRGMIQIELVCQAESLAGWVELPQGVTGKLVYAGHSLALRAGRQEITLGEA